MAHDLHEEAARPQVGADAVVDEVAVLPDQADGAGPHAPDLGVGLEQEKDLQQGHGIVAEDIRVGHLQEAADGLETPVDGHRRPKLVPQQDGLAGSSCSSISLSRFSSITVR